MLGPEHFVWVFFVGVFVSALVCFVCALCVRACVCVCVCVCLSVCLSVCLCIYVWVSAEVVWVDELCVSVVEAFAADSDASV